MNNLAVGYLRYSSDNQRSESIDAQKRAIEEFSARKGYEMVEWYIDEALTATTDNREEFQRMIRDSDRRKWQYVIVHKLDRFARNKYDSAIYKRALKINGVRVISVLENIDDSPESAILESVLEGMAEYFSRNLSREVKKGLRENAHQGRLTGGFPPLGYGVDAKGKYVIVEDEADVVRLIYAWHDAQISYKEISDRLNAMGKTTRSGGVFMPNSIHDILKNPKYKGTLVHSRFTRGLGDKSSWRRKDGDENTLYIPGAIPEIVDESLWDRVNWMMNNRKRAGSSHANRTYILSGLVFCGECGMRMEGHSARETYYYRCVGKKKNNGCTSSKVNAETLEVRMIKLITDEVLNERSIAALTSKLIQVATGKDAEAKEDISALADRLAEIEEQSARLLDAIMEMGTSITITAKLKALESEKVSIAKAITESELESKFYSMPKSTFEEILLSDMTALQNKEDALIASVLRRYIQRITVTFDPNDPPRSGHKRTPTVDVQGIIPVKTGPMVAPPRMCWSGACFL